MKKNTYLIKYKVRKQKGVFSAEVIANTSETAVSNFRMQNPNFITTTSKAILVKQQFTDE